MLLRKLRYVGYGLTALSIPILVYFLASIILSLIPTRPQEIKCQKKSQIYVASNGIHLDLILPRELVSRNLLDQLQAPDWASFLAFGWGDKEFYINTPTWDDFKLGIALQALFTKSQSAVHVVWLRNKSAHWLGVPLCHQQQVLINDYIKHTFEWDRFDQLIEIQAAGYTNNDKFYQGRGSFNLIHTCNNWVNNGLKTAQVKTSVWSPFDKGVLYQVRKTNGMGE